MKLPESARPLLLMRRVLPRCMPRVHLSTAEPPAGGRRDDSLFDRLLRMVDPRSSVVPVLEKWVTDGNSVDKSELRKLAKLMKDYRRERHALEISEWMSDRRYFSLSPSDTAFRLGLIYKVYGIEDAEKYFDQIPKGVHASQPYGALLCCYVEQNDEKKAESLAQMMIQLGIKSSFLYNQLIKLYSQIGQHDKVNNVIKEMEEGGTSPDKFTFNLLMDAYGIAHDVDGIERLMKQMEKDCRRMIDWHILALAAKGYMQSGFKEKAIAMLKKAEELVPIKVNKFAFGLLLSLYGDLKQKDDLYRIWNQYSTSERPLNSVYMCMISTLLKLDDIEGAEKILEVWEDHFVIYDFRVPNLLVAAYCKKHLFEKAESYINKAIERGRKPLAASWGRLASAYHEENQVRKAVEALKKALAVEPCLWKPNPATVDASLQYLEQKGDVEGAENFVSLLRSSACLTREVYHRLLRTYILAGRPVSDVLDQIKQDGFSVDKQTTRILEETIPAPNLSLVK